MPTTTKHLADDIDRHDEIMMGLELCGYHRLRQRGQYVRFRPPPLTDGKPFLTAIPHTVVFSEDTIHIVPAGMQFDHGFVLPDRSVQALLEQVAAYYSMEDRQRQQRK